MALEIVFFYILGVLAFGFLFYKRFPSSDLGFLSYLSCLIVGSFWPFVLAITLIFLVCAPDMAIYFWLNKRRNEGMQKDFEEDEKK